MTLKIIFDLIGYFVFNGFMVQYECEIGIYMSYNGYVECFECLLGFYCLDKGMINRIVCSVGLYCGNGSYVFILCELGYYFNL